MNSETTDPAAELIRLRREEKRRQTEAWLAQQVEARVAPLRERVAALEARQTDDEKLREEARKDVARDGWKRAAAIIASLVTLVPLAQAILGPLLASHNVDPATVDAVVKALQQLQAAQVEVVPAPPPTETP